MKNKRVDENGQESGSEELGSFIRELRKRERMSLRELAQLAGLDDHTYIFAVEKGKKASMKLLYKLIDIFQLSDDECKKLLKLAGKKDLKYLKPIEKEFIEVLEEKGIEVGAYGGSFSEETIRILIEEFKKWD